ncbi:MAG: hypothetical protein GPJ54_15485 [Candidatus Heimdallarchaeota archaeon]|nr:hypothetical protein [Candidatus Heimdallarchaeota archaeon]
MTIKDLTYDQTYPTSDRVAERLPYSLKFVIFSNYYFSINGWSVFFFMIIYLMLLQLNMDFVFIIVMFIPSFTLSTLSIIISKKLLLRSNIFLSLFHVLMDILLIDMLNTGPVSSSIQAELNVGKLYWFLMSLLFISLILSCGSLLVLISNQSLKRYYQIKDSYIKPWFIQNFGVTSILASVPFVIIYTIYF